MKNRRLPWPLLAVAFIVLALIVAGCGGDDESDSAGTTTATVQDSPAKAETEQSGGGDKSQPGSATSGAAKAEKAGTEIKLASSPVGDALFDGEDQAIYLFDIETRGTSECYGECAAEWPPVLTKGEPVADGPVKQSLLGTTKRDDGTTQVTYNDHPLYYYAHEGAGELRCHNVPGFGGLWLALGADGDPLS